MKLTPVAALEAILFASGEPMSKKKLGGLLGLKDTELTEVVAALRESLSGRGVALIEVSEGLELRTAPETAQFVEKLREGELSKDLGRAGLETLAIVLYRKNATRSEIDWIRGVNSSATVRALLMRGLLERTDDPNDKRRARYQLTHDALAHLGLRTIDEAPSYEELSRALTEAETSKQEAVETHA
jgi:segregation and condensation protein B